MRYYYTYSNTGTNENLLFSQNKTIEKKQNNILLYVKTNHLGNVRATIKATGSTGEYQLTTRTDYYAFGGAQPGRTYNLNTYRFNYQGQESAVNSRWQAFDLRMHNSDLGRWFAPDPYGQFHSPYVSMGNNPVGGTDPDGGYYIGNDASRWRGYGQAEPTEGPGYVGGSWEKSVYELNKRDTDYLSAYKKWQKHWGDGWVNGNLSSVDAQAALEVIKRQYGKNDNTDYGALSARNHNMLMSSHNSKGTSWIDQDDEAVMRNVAGRKRSRELLAKYRAEDPCPGCKILNAISGMFAPTKASADFHSWSRNTKVISLPEFNITNFHRNSANWGNTSGNVGYTTKHPYTLNINTWNYNSFNLTITQPSGNQIIIPNPATPGTINQGNGSQYRGGPGDQIQVSFPQGTRDRWDVDVRERWWSSESYRIWWGWMQN